MSNSYATTNETIILCSVANIATLFNLIFVILCIHIFIKAKTSMMFLFKIIAFIGILSNFLSSLCIGMYFGWSLAIEIDYNIPYFFLKHHKIFRTSATVFHYISKICIFILFNARLYYSFQRGKYISSKRCFIFLNIFTTIFAIVSITVGYLGVFIYNKHNFGDLLEWIGFNAFRIVYIILLIYISYEFNRRLVAIIKDVTLHSKIDLKESISIELELMPENTDSVRKSPKLNKNDLYNTSSAVKKINVLVKSTILLLLVIISMIIVSIAWFLVNYTFNSDHLSTCIALTLMSYDSMMNIIAIILSFNFAQKYYKLLCHTLCYHCHHCFQSCITSCIVNHMNKPINNDNNKIKNKNDQNNQNNQNN